MANNLYQPQPLKIEYGNLAQNINKEELENAIKNPVERNRMYQLITGIKDKIQPVTTTLGNVIFGKEEPATITQNQDGTTSIEVSNKRKGGLLNALSDFDKGFQENYTEDFKVANLLPNENKGFANRFGEAVGTLTRSLVGPLGDAWVAGYSGLPAAMERQNVRVADKVYRDDLEKMGVDTSGIKGYISEDMYKNVISSQRAKNNRQNVGELAMLSPVIKKFVDANPALANVDIPASVANSLLRGDYTEAQIQAIMSNIALNNVKAGYYGSLTDVNKAALGEIGKGGGGVVVHTQPPQVVHNTNAF